MPSGVSEESTLDLDTAIPSTKEEFEQYGSVLTQKLNQLAKNSEFPLFGEELIKSVALNCKYIALYWQWVSYWVPNICSRLY